AVWEDFMAIQGKTVLLLGAGGLVGMALARRLLEERPRKMVLLSLTRKESRAAAAELKPLARKAELIPQWGNIFSLSKFKDTPPDELRSNSGWRQEQIAALITQLDEALLKRYFLHRVISRFKPEIVVDAVNTATAIAYQDVYRSSQLAFDALRTGQDLAERLEDLLSVNSVPQLIRHIQVAYQSMVNARTRLYLKIGTSGTGGMGLNIPYTHSEERPSRVLLAKSAVAGAHSLLLFLMARTPDAPIVKEIKPTAAIAWKRVQFGEIAAGRRTVELNHAPMEWAKPPGRNFRPRDSRFQKPLGRRLHSVFIDTGENGIFSLEEFSTLTTAEQMEFVTPEEIADFSVYEIKGGNTGHDIINALDNAALGPTYRAGLMRHWALEKMIALEKEHGVSSVAFEMLGPPRLSKLLFEAHLLRRNFVTMTGVLAARPEHLAKKLASDLGANAELRSEIISIGIPILFPDGRLLRGPEVKVPPAVTDEDSYRATPKRLESWIEGGWVDLRVKNMRRWLKRFRSIQAEIAAVLGGDTSSRFLRDRTFWQEEGGIQPGKVVGWIFAVEEAGARMK
ncbi:MAG: short-chain dehydrogenase, partial [Vicinamibacteria bacterium]